MSRTQPPLLALAAGRKVRPRRAKVEKPKESRLHTDVAGLLRDHCLPGWKWRHISGKAADAREGAILKRMGVNPGWPDFILISPVGSPYFLELKREGGKLSREQESFRLWCTKTQLPYFVASTMDQVGAACGVWGCLRVKFPQRSVAS